MQTLLDGTKGVKITQENAGKEMRGLDWLIILIRISFDRGKIQRKVCASFYRKHMGTYLGKFAFF